MKPQDGQLGFWRYLGFPWRRQPGPWRLAACLAVATLGAAQGCGRTHCGSFGRDTAALVGALKDYAVQNGWQSLVVLSGGVADGGTEGNALLMETLFARQLRPQVAPPKPEVRAVLQRGMVVLDGAGRMVDAWGRPYRIALDPQLDDDGQCRAVKLSVSSVGPNGIDDHGKGDDQTWGTVLRW
jgi:hypothetical protein